MKAQTIAVKLDVVKIIKANSREVFANVPRNKRIEDKRRRKPRYGWKAE